MEVDIVVFVMYVNYTCCTSSSLIDCVDDILPGYCFAMFKRTGDRFWLFPLAYTDYWMEEFQPEVSDVHIRCWI